MTEIRLSSVTTTPKSLFSVTQDDGMKTYTHKGEVIYKKKGASIWRVGAFHDSICYELPTRIEIRKEGQYTLKHVTYSHVSVDDFCSCTRVYSGSQLVATYTSIGNRIREMAVFGDKQVIRTWLQFGITKSRYCSYDKVIHKECPHLNLVSVAESLDIAMEYFGKPIINPERNVPKITDAPASERVKLTDLPIFDLRGKEGATVNRLCNEFIKYCFDQKPILVRYWDNGAVKSMTWGVHMGAKIRIHNATFYARIKWHKNGVPKMLKSRIGEFLECIDGAPAYVKFYDTGVISKMLYYAAGKLHNTNGPAYVRFWPNGNRSEEGYYLNGVSKR
jgi:hypothetical protein